ncbi:MAG: MFS transporter, partial [Desulfosarcina sp.]|nr:MFS transporter [Desulfobacterales bacterium]
TAFVIMGVIIGAIGLPAALLLKHPQENSAARITKKKQIAMPEFQDGMIARQAVRTLPFLMLLYIFMALLFGISTIMSHLVAHVEDLGFDPMSAAFIITLIGAGGIIGRIMIGGIADRVGNKIMLSLCLIIQMLLFFVLIFAEKLWTFYLVGACYGLSYGGSIPNIIILNSKFFGIGSAGKIFGILFFGAMFGGAAGAPIAGYVYDITNKYSVAFFIGGILILTASILSIIIKPPGNNY